MVGVQPQLGEVDAAAGDDVGEVAERLGQRCGVRVGIDEDERPPGLDGNRKQREVGGVETLLALRARRATKRPVELVRPGVIGTLQRLAAAVVAGDHVGAMAADVHEPPEHPSRSRVTTIGT